MTAFLANAAGEGAWGFGADAGVGAGVGVVACSVGSVVLSDMVAVSSAMASSL